MSDLQPKSMNIETSNFKVAFPLGISITTFSIKFLTLHQSSHFLSPFPHPFHLFTYFHPSLGSILHCSHLSSSFQPHSSPRVFPLPPNLVLVSITFLTSPILALVECPCLSPSSSCLHHPNLLLTWPHQPLLFCVPTSIIHQPAYKQDDLSIILLPSSVHHSWPAFTLCAHFKSNYQIISLLLFIMFIR